VPADPLASLEPFDLEIEVAGRDFLLPAAPAVDWLRIFLANNPTLDDILPGMAGPQCRAHLYRSMMAGSFTTEEWKQLLLDIIEAVSGRRWWQALNLINAMKEPANWTPVHGHLLLRGIDVRQVSLAAWLDATYALVTENMDKDEKIKFQLAIDTVPDSVSAEDAIDEAEQERAFLAMMQAVQSA
jgi:hypothetical protein